MQRHVSNMSQTIIESDEVTSCDISNLVNSIPETPNTVRSSPNTYPESPVFPKYTIQRKNKLHYGTTKSEKEDKDNTPNGHIHFYQICPLMITSPIRLCKKGNISIIDML